MVPIAAGTGDHKFDNFKQHSHHHPMLAVRSPTWGSLGAVWTGPGAGAGVVPSLSNLLHPQGWRLNTSLCASRLPCLCL
jgi:hypothetical protein